MLNVLSNEDGDGLLELSEFEDLKQQIQRDLQYKVCSYAVNTIFWTPKEGGKHYAVVCSYTVIFFVFSKKNFVTNLINFK